MTITLNHTQSEQTNLQRHNLHLVQTSRNLLKLTETLKYFYLRSEINRKQTTIQVLVNTKFSQR